MEQSSLIWVKEKIPNGAQTFYGKTTKIEIENTHNASPLTTTNLRKKKSLQKRRARWTAYFSFQKATLDQLLLCVSLSTSLSSWGGYKKPSLLWSYKERHVSVRWPAVSSWEFTVPFQWALFPWEISAFESSGRYCAQTALQWKGVWWPLASSVPWLSPVSLPLLCYHKATLRAPK